MRNLVTVVFLPVVLVLGNPLGPANNWSNEQDSYTLAPPTNLSTPFGRIGIVLMPNATDQTPKVPDATTISPTKTKTTPIEPSLSEIMEIIEDTMQEIEASQSQKYSRKISPDMDSKSQPNLLRSTEPTTTESDSAEFDEDSTESSTTEQSTTNNVNDKSVENDSVEVEKGNSNDQQQQPDNKKYLGDNQPIKNYADKFDSYKPMTISTTEIPKDMTPQETSTNTDPDTTTVQDDSNSGDTITDKDNQGPLPDIQNNQDVSKAPETMVGNNDGDQSPQLHHVLLTKNSDLMDKVIFENPESNEGQVEDGPTQPPPLITHLIFRRPTTFQPDALKYYVEEPTEPTLTRRLLPPKPYSPRTNSWNMYPDVSSSQIQPFSDNNMISPNEEAVPDAQEPQVQTMPSPQIMNNLPSDFYQYPQPPMAMQMNAPMLPLRPYQFQPQPYFNNYNSYQYQRAAQMYPQQMFSGSRGLGFYGDYNRNPFWTRQSPVYNRPTYWGDSYGYNNNLNYNGAASPMYYDNMNPGNGMPMTMSGSQYYYY